MMKNFNMKKQLMYSVPVMMLFVVTQVKAQQNSLFNTYSLDPLQLNMAYAGAACTEANVHYRTQWIGVKESPKLLQLNAHTALGKSNALGLRINSQSQGLLNSLQATLGYAYRFRVSEKAKVHLGLGLGWTQATLNAQKAIVIDANDVTLSAGKQTAGGFDSEFGAMFIGEKLKAGVSVLHIYNSNPDFSGSNTYKTLPQLNTQVSYTFNKGKKLEVEPWLLNRYTVKGTNIVEGMLNVHFINMFTLGAGYRSGYGVLALVGAKAGNIRLAYSFDYGTTKNATSLGSSHQVMLGFSLCKTAKPSKPKEDESAAAPIQTITPLEPVAQEPLKEEAPIREEVKPIAPVKEETVIKEKTKPEEAPVKEDILAQMNTLAEGVVFEINQSQLNEEGLKKLDAIAALMKKDPSLVVNVVGHTCNKGTDQINNSLSVCRAAYVKAELVKRGANPEKINRSKGVGSSNALYDNTSDQQKKNRTVRFEAAK